METRPEKPFKEMNTIFLIGYYTLILESNKLAPDWREAYEQRLTELKGELSEQ